MITVSHSPTKTVKSHTTASYDFTFSTVNYDTINTPGSTVDSVDQDLNLRTHTGATISSVFDIALDTASGVPEFKSLNTNITTVDQFGKVTAASSGTAILTVGNSLCNKVVNKPVLFISPTGDAVEIISHVSGSLGKECEDAVNSRIAGLTANDTTKIIHDGTAYNSSCWAADIDLTAVCLNIPRATAITPRHVAMASHYQHNGDIYFMAADGTRIGRTVIAVKQVYKDAKIGLLSSDLPASISPVKIAGDLTTKLPTRQGYPVPALVLDQEEKALAHDLRFSGVNVAAYSYPTDNHRRTFSEKLIGGDSGNPGFLIVGGEAHLVSTWHHGGSGDGPDWSELVSETNAAIATIDSNNSISTGYTVTVADYSAYNTY